MKLFLSSNTFFPGIKTPCDLRNFARNIFVFQKDFLILIDPSSCESCEYSMKIGHAGVCVWWSRGQEVLQ